MSATPGRFSWYLCGVPGSGKSSLVNPLRAALGGRVVVADMDQLLDTDGKVLGIPIASAEGAHYWARYNEAWMRIAAMVTESGVPLLLLGPLLPAELEQGGPGKEWSIGILDCPDEVLADRLQARGWSDGRIAEAMNDARLARRAISMKFSSTGDISTAVEAITNWISQALKPRV
ncbi:MAG: AAA family ATPase [Dehalococcoidia bacterium]